MNEESRKEKKRLERRLKTIHNRIEKLGIEYESLLTQVYKLKGRCYRCEKHGRLLQGECRSVFSDCLIPLVRK